MSLELVFPGLRETGYRITSPATKQYNCLAWAASRTDRWWWPDPLAKAYWPSQAPREETVTALVAAFHTLGFQPCPDATVEAGYEKIAIYGFGSRPAHAALQQINGKWSSKLGKNVDIEHTLEGLEGARYGKVLQFLKRAAHTG